MHDAKSAVECMRRALEAFLAPLADVSAARWSLRPPGEEWSLGETVEHVTLAAQGTLARLERKLFASPLPPDAERFDDERIDGGMFRSDGPAPALAVPTGRFPTPAEGVTALRAACDGLAAWAARITQDPRAFGLRHTVFGTFDGVQWILFMAAHLDNHAPQVRTVLARLENPQPPGA